MVSAWSKVALVAGLAASAYGQTYSDCNPMKKSGCKPNPGLDASLYSFDFTKGADDDNWEGTGHGEVKYTSEGAEFSVNKQGDSPTLQSKWYMFFGRYEVHMKAAPGVGIVSSIVMLSDVLDEVDWEFLGGAGGEVQTNWYAKASSDNTQSLTFPADNNQGEFHNYTVNWTPESVDWYVNDVQVRTVKFAESNYPQTPMRLKLGIWAGGDPDNAEGTIQWAGGETDYKDVPYTMTVQKIKVQNLNPAKEYSYGDSSGSYKSIDFDKKDNGREGNMSEKDEEKEQETKSASEAASTTSSDSASKTASESEATTMSTAKSSETASADFKNNGAAETTGADADATSTGSTASSTAESDENSASGNLPKMWLSLGALCAAMVMM
ncbi:murein transglycosylase [Fusarium flagelliforme]|uniref:Crh-like protein n=1 Tax=Fusarium flagelliforme TaxID=2675880 RepID=A0A395MZS3_9HYPO|nr:murein transglycosylase [Fusarium flagelliforme]